MSEQTMQFLNHYSFSCHSCNIFRLMFNPIKTILHRNLAHQLPPFPRCEQPLWNSDAKPAVSILLIDTNVTPICGAYKTSFKRILVVVLLFGMVICISPFPMALKVPPSAAVSTFFWIETKLIKFCLKGDMCRDASES